METRAFNSSERDQVSRDRIFPRFVPFLLPSTLRRRIRNFSLVSLDVSQDWITANGDYISRRFWSRYSRACERSTTKDCRGSKFLPVYRLRCTTGERRRVYERSRKTRCVYIRKVRSRRSRMFTSPFDFVLLFPSPTVVRRSELCLV